MNERFEYQGYWWLPDTPEEQAPGTLKFDPDEGPTLNLVGSFGGIKGSSGTIEDLFPSSELGLILGYSVRKRESVPPLNVEALTSYHEPSKGDAKGRGARG